MQIVELCRSWMPIMCGIVENIDISILQMVQRRRSLVKYRYYWTNGTMASIVHVRNEWNCRNKDSTIVEIVQ